MPFGVRQTKIELECKVVRVTSVIGMLQEKENLRDERLKNFCSSHNILGFLRKTELGESSRMQDKAMNIDILLKNLRATSVKQSQWLNKFVENFRSL
jgi:hypothetical protein